MYDKDQAGEDDDKILTIHPPRQLRPAKFLETVSNRVIVIFTDNLTSPNKTQGATLIGDQYSPTWTLEQEVTLTWTDGTRMFLACGEELFESAGGTGEPTLVKQLPSNITSIGPTSVGLDNGDVFVLSGEEWIQTVSGLPSSPITAIGSWIGALDEIHYVVGTNDDILREQDNVGGWVDSHQLLPPVSGDLTIDSISTINKIGTYDDEGLLIGTSNSGILIDMVVTKIKEGSGAFLLTNIEDVTGTAVFRNVA